MNAEGRRRRRPARDAEGHDVALVLSGGGAKGAFEAGVAQALEEAGIVPGILAGTSAGALNAAALATGIGADGLVDLWTTIRSNDVFRLRFDVHRLFQPWRGLKVRGYDFADLTDRVLSSIGWTWVFHTDPLRHLLIDILGTETLTVPDDTVLTVSCVEVDTGRLVRFANVAPRPERDDPRVVVTDLTVDHLVGSAAIPGLFEPPRIDGHLYWDGGIVSNTPLRAAMHYEPDTAFVVATGAVDRQAEEPDNAAAAISLVIDHVLRSALLQDIDHAETVNKLVRAVPDQSRYKFVELIVIAPPPEVAELSRFLDFEPEIAKELIAAGLEEGRRAVEVWRAGGGQSVPDRFSL